MAPMAAPYSLATFLVNVQFSKWPKLLSLPSGPVGPTNMYAQCQTNYLIIMIAHVGFYYKNIYQVLMLIQVTDIHSNADLGKRSKFLLQSRHGSQ